VLLAKPPHASFVKDLHRGRGNRGLIAPADCAFAVDRQDAEDSLGLFGSFNGHSVPVRACRLLCGATPDRFGVLVGEPVGNHDLIDLSAGHRIDAVVDLLALVSSDCIPSR
jgi:hypothetical protein